MKSKPVKDSSQPNLIDRLTVRALNAHYITLVMAVMTMFKQHLNHLLVNKLIRWPKCVEGHQRYVWWE